MVHALQQIHNLLKPGGYLIDIHPVDEQIKFICPIDKRDHFIGYLDVSNYFSEYRQADEAVKTAIENNLFTNESSGNFEFRNYANSFSEMKTYLAETWDEAVITDEVMVNAKNLEAEHGEYKTILCERVKIGLLKVIQK